MQFLTNCIELKSERRKKNLNKGFTKLTVKQDETKALLL